MPKNDKAVITPLRKMVANSGIEAMLTFLAQFRNVCWRLSWDEDFVFRAEIRVKGATYEGSHQYMASHALAHALVEFLIQENKDYREYSKGEKE